MKTKKSMQLSICSWEDCFFYFGRYYHAVFDNEKKKLGTRKPSKKFGSCCKPIPYLIITYYVLVN
jgi:hypothetical protein